MKTKALTSILLAAALSGAPVAFGSGPAKAPRATATVELVNPEKFTDFKTSFVSTETDARHLGREFQREVNRVAGNILPAGYKVMLRVHDIDMAGDIEPFRRAAFDDIRIMRSVHTPKIHLEYSVTDAAGNVVASGERRLTDLSYDMRLRTAPVDRLTIETDLVADFFREISRAAS